MSNTDSFSWVTDAVAAENDWAQAIYREFHRHPELSFQEVWTTERISRELESFGLTPTPVGHTGLGVVISNGEGPTVMTRADIDGLPVTEITGVEYASEQDGVMHACGHDTHITGLLGALKVLNSHRDAWHGTVIGIFQPAEEVGTGAQSMVDAGLTSIFPKPDIVLGQHIGPGPAGYVAVRPGPTMSQADSVKVTLHGKGAHGSSPHQSKDPIVLAAAIIMRLQTIISREVPPSETSVLTVASIHAGSGSNIIPPTAELQLNLRNYNSDVRDHVIAALERVIRSECDASGFDEEPEIEYFNQFPLTDNDQAAAQRTITAFKNYFGDKFMDAPQSPASEDFPDLADAYGTPYCYWFVSAPVVGNIPGAMNHSPNYAPVPEDALPTLIEAMTVATLEWLTA